MANISSAFGQIKITASNKKEIEEIIDVINNIKTEYYTSISKTMVEEDKVNDQISETYPFIACGRWSYETTLKGLYENIKDPLKEKGINKYTLRFDYTDYETGCEFIIDETAVIEVDSDNYDLSIDTLIEYEFTTENLRDICGEEEVYNYTTKYFEEYVADILAPYIQRRQKEENIEVSSTEEIMEYSMKMRNELIDLDDLTTIFYTDEDEVSPEVIDYFVK